MIFPPHTNQWVAGACALWIAQLSFAGDYLNLTQFPPGSGYKGPAPNVIISVDDSGSMGASGMTALRTALQETFRPENVPDGSIRLAYQSMNVCDSIPSAAAGCDNKNYMQKLYGNYDATEDSPRGRFLKWLTTLSAVGNTPTHKMMRSAGEYLKTTGPHSPWNAEPGKNDSKPLSCRKAYHVLMTDGGWNYTGQTQTIDGNASQAGIYNNTIDNVDGSTQTFPDGTVYNPAAAESRIYADPWARQANAGGGSGTYWQGDNGIAYPRQNYCSINTTNCQPVSDLSWRYISPTLSDLAFHYWATDLQPGIANKIKPTILQAGDETISIDSQTQTLPEYWNPKNNPATWQHMINYTIGYKSAASWPTITGDPKFGSNTFDGDYARLVVGTRKWQNPVQPPLRDASGASPVYYLNHGYTTFYPPSVGAEDVRQQEMWHLALNSRGKFVPAKTAQDLVAAFKDLLASIVADNNQAVAGYSSASSSISTAGTSAFMSFYEATGWKGGLRSFSVAQNTGALGPNPAWGLSAGNNGLSTADKLDALGASAIDARLVLTHDGSQGTEFQFGNLSAAQKTLLSHSKAGSVGVDSLAEDRVKYIRGDRSKEGSTFRTRNSRQGDIVNSAIWYTGAPTRGYNLPGYTAFTKAHRTRTPMLYVGGNDGMLHGFSALNGAEKLAYIPRGQIRNLPNLADPSYSHRYFVDGSPFTGDVFLSTAPGADADKWRTMLVGAQGAGGKGYFVLDVTKPGSTDASGVASNFAAAHASTLVVTDTTDGVDADIGHIFGEPVVNEYNNQVSAQIAQLNNGRWAAILGNGYNSGNEDPVLLIQYLDGDRALVKLPAATTGAEAVANGLSTPRLVDVNGDGMPDVVYAGDLRGNVWKFLIASSNSAGWGVAFAGNPLFTASHTQGVVTKRQPITTAPLVRVNSAVGGMMVAFGTGRNLIDADAADKSQQSFYSVLDNTRYEIETSGANRGKVKLATGAASDPVTGRSALVERTFNATAIGGTNASAGQDFWNMGAQTALSYQSKKGWFLDLPESAERVIRQPQFYSAGSKVIEILSEQPAVNDDGTEERCEPVTTAAKAWRTLLGIEFGQPPTQQLLDANGDGTYSSSADQSVNRMSTSTKQITLRAKGERVHVGPLGTEKTNELARPFSSVNWRQLQ